MKIDIKNIEMIEVPDSEYQQFLEWKENEIDTSKITRFEVINHSREDLSIGRILTLHNIDNIELSFQDDNRTLKVFL